MVLPKVKWRKQPKNCCVSNCEKELIGWTGYLFFADETAQDAAWCRDHVSIFSDAANPIFENKEALDLLKKKHPKTYNAMIAIGKQITFLNELASFGKQEMKTEVKTQ